MSSSDSEDDCYGNVAQKLQSIKNTYHCSEQAIAYTSTDQNKSVNVEETRKNETISQGNAAVDANTSMNSTDNDELTLDAIIANNTKLNNRRGKRKNTQDNDENTESTCSTRVTRSCRRKTSDSMLNTSTQSAKAQGNQGNSAVPTRRGRGRSRPAKNRGKGRNRDRGFTCLPPDAFFPVYSVGNTDEYPDMCDNQQLFATANNDDVQILDDGEELEDDNEELSVKVYWQNIEVFKFKIRKYQKLTQIFEYFSKKENVGNNQLLFMYNDKILKVDDTPDTINYNIAKFIDGGIVKRNVTDLVKSPQKSTVTDGIKIKFQCQNVKKPYEMRVRVEDKLASAMMKYAEHIEKPLERLKFYFDGDLINGKSTPKDLELEGGDCIDVKLSS